MFAENQDIRNVNSDAEIVKCIQTGTYGQMPAQIIEFFNSLPKTNFYDYLRTLAVPFLFNAFERNLMGDKNPVISFKEDLFKLKKLTSNIIESGPLEELMSQIMIDDKIPEFPEEIKVHTGIHYGKLFQEFDHYSFFDEAKDLLETRLKINDIHIPELRKMKVLDQGSGGGRYTAAWKLLGAKSAVGLDYSEIGIQDARARVKMANIDNIEFDLGSVLDMPYEDEKYDFVFSNGVLHHTENWKQGISEQLRVLKPGGYGWLYLIEDPGGLFWDQIELLRAIMKKVNKSFAQQVMKSLNIPPNRVFYMLDHVMVPINTRLAKEDIESQLVLNGATSIHRLNRGVKFDRVEYIYKNIPYSSEKFGIGENRYFFKKK
ncbi:class I SAM-dependent methyltransferase [Gramella sp. MAR_2010_147]|uniref:class I SAM-dependent methyltransferase n=1 Tax=Gramella sp. MAR_2010_147 TaxID=1250205 RepID=UPI00087A0424|nr:class I SAM-dependent methyltransferase [Gramella sp. MAR_2010_147]SDS01250.1 Methyltransferase domain-containing protein [Gramella sp. MAR_2010_147]